MTSTLLAPIAPASPAGRRRRLWIRTTGDPDVLLRVLTVLRRRGCTVVGVDFRAAGRHAPATLEISLTGSRRVQAWVRNVVGVLAVGEDGHDDDVLSRR